MVSEQPALFNPYEAVPFKTLAKVKHLTYNIGIERGDHYGS